jgi:hypothetical protein
MVNGTEQFKEQNLDIKPEDAPKTLAEQLGRQPSEFESKLLAHPGENSAQKKIAAELMIGQTGYGIENISQIQDASAQNRLNELAVAYMETSAIQDTTERIKKRKEIVVETKGIFDKAFDEE